MTTERALESGEFKAIYNLYQEPNTNNQFDNKTNDVKGPLPTEQQMLSSSSHRPNLRDNQQKLTCSKENDPRDVQNSRERIDEYTH